MKKLRRCAQREYDINTVPTLLLEQENFLSWFIGFCDAEGNFQTTKFKRINNKNGELTSIGLKYSIHIGLNIRDREILELINSRFYNIGTIYDYENKKESHLAIVKIDSLKWMIENVFNHHFLLTKHQSNRFFKLKSGILNNIKSFKTELELENYFQSISIINPDLSNLKKDFLDNWFLGFLNGEVAFTFSKKTTKKIPVINLEHTDEDVIKLIKERFNLSCNIQIRNRPGRKTTYCLYISKTISPLAPYKKYYKFYR